MQRLARKLVLLVLLLSQIIAFGQDRTVGLLKAEEGLSDGYVLFHPIPDNDIYLINNCGQLVHKWQTSYRPGHSVYLQPDGSIFHQGLLTNPVIHAGGAGGVIERIDWEGNKTWRYEYSSGTFRSHHDYQVLANGNVLILAWELITEEEAIANGRDPALLTENALWPEHIIEVEPTGTEGGNIVWEWHSWDHLVQDYDESKSNYGVVSDNPGKINVNYTRTGVTGADWHHANALNYNPELDQIMISVLHFDEVWIIDHNSTTEEAKGEKGDLLFRWGNPMTYNSGSIEEKKLFGQHDAHWIKAGLPDAGKIMIFNNGRARPEGAYSSIVKLAPIIQDGVYQKNVSGQFFPDDYSYEYTANPPTDFFSRFLSNAQQMPNGNILVNAGAFGTFFEINEEEEIVWKYVSPITYDGPAEQGGTVVEEDGSGTNILFRAEKYPSSFSAFEGRNLIGGDLLEINGNNDLCLIPLANKVAINVDVYPNPANEYVIIDGNVKNYSFIDLNGHVISEGKLESERRISLKGLPEGVYFLRINDSLIKKILVVN